MILADAVYFETNRVNEAAKWINNINIKEEYKSLFFILSFSRGFRDLETFEHQIIEISKEMNDTIKLFMIGKIIGIRKLHEVAKFMDIDCQNEYYQRIKNTTVKRQDKFFRKCIEEKHPGHLFSEEFYEEN